MEFEDGGVGVDIVELMGRSEGEVVVAGWQCVLYTEKVTWDSSTIYKRVEVDSYLFHCSAGIQWWAAHTWLVSKIFMNHAAVWLRLGSTVFGKGLTSFV